MASKGMPATVRGMDKGSSMKMAEVEQTSVYCDSSPAIKKRAICNKLPVVNVPDDFDATLSDMNREVSELILKYSEMLRERISMDAADVTELDNILTDAKNLESLLKEKKDQLRRSLAVISDKLQG